jgi:hypothetical protein
MILNQRRRVPLKAKGEKKKEKNIQKNEQQIDTLIKEMYQSKNKNICN